MRYLLWIYLMSNYFIDVKKKSDFKIYIQILEINVISLFALLLYNYTPAPRRGRGVYCFTSVRLSVRPRYFSSHFSQQLSMAEI